MNMQEYKKLFPNEKVYPRLVSKNNGDSAVITDGMLQFDDSACNWGGPFDGGFAYYALIDNRDIAGFKLISEVDFRQYNRFSCYCLPGLWKGHVKSEEHLQKRLALLTPFQRKEWQRLQDIWKPDRATIENPFSIYMCGNDDTSYTKFYPILEIAAKELAILILDQPLNMEFHIEHNGFVFTN